MRRRGIFLTPMTAPMPSPFDRGMSTSNLENPIDGNIRNRYHDCMKQSANIPTIDIKRYGGKQVAIAGGKVIASGRTLAAVIREAQRRAPNRPLHEIRIFSVPKTLAVIFYA